MPFKNIEIDTNSRDWVSEYADMFDGQPISYYLADIIGSSVTTATQFYFNFPPLKKSYKFTVSWNNDGFDEHDIERLQKVHSVRRDNKKGQSVRGRGLRCVIENFYKGIGENVKRDEQYTTFLSRSKDYKNGEITAIVFAPNMQIDIRPATPEEREKYKTHMEEQHNIKNNNHGIMGEFRVNRDKAQEIFTPNKINFAKKKPEVQPQIIKDIQLILNRRLVNEDGSSGDVSLVINDKEYRPSVRFIHSHPKQRYICLRATIGQRRLAGGRSKTACLRLTNESWERIQQLREENGEMRHLEDIKRFINFHSGGGHQIRKNCNARKYLDGEEGWMMDEASHFEPELVKVGKVWMEKELELRFSVGPPPEKGHKDDGAYLKNTSSKDGACGIFMYHDNTIVNLRGIRKLYGIRPGQTAFNLFPPGIFTNCQIPCVEIEEMNIGLGDSKIFTTKAVKAASVQFKANTNFFIALSEFINCFLKRHMYFRNISEEKVEAQKQKKEQEKRDKAALEKAMKEQVLMEKQKKELEKLEKAALEKVMKEQAKLEKAALEKVMKEQALIEKQKKEQDKLEKAALEKAMKKQAAKLLVEKEKVPNVVISPPKQRVITEMLKVVKPKVEVKEESEDKSEEVVPPVVQKITPQPVVQKVTPPPVVVQEESDSEETEEESIEEMKEEVKKEVTTAIQSNDDKYGFLYAVHFENWVYQGEKIWNCGSSTDTVEHVRQRYQKQDPLQTVQLFVIAEHVFNCLKAEQHDWHVLLKNKNLKKLQKRNNDNFITTGREYFVEKFAIIKKHGEAAASRAKQKDEEKVSAS